MTTHFATIKAAIIRSLLFLVLFAIATAIVVIPYMSKIDKQLPPEWARLMEDVLSLLPLLFASWVMVRYADKTPVTTIGFKNRHIAADMGRGTAMGAAWMLLALAGQYFFHTIVKANGTSLAPPHFLIYVVALLINATAQEVLCRGYLFHTIKVNMGARPSVIITSLFFMCIHAGALKAGIIPAVNVFAAGLVFAIARVKTGNLWMPVALHFTWNFLDSSILFEPLPGYGGLHLLALKGSTLLAGGQNGIEATIITTAATALVIAAEKSLLKKRLPA